MTKRLIVMLATILLSACISFLPTYDQAVHKQLEGAVGEINKIGTAVSLPYRRPAFSEVEPYYISAFSNLKAAEEMAAGRVQAFRGSLPSRAATILARAISNCRQALEQLRELHRTQGINEADFTESSVRRTCTIPQMMEERLKR